MCVFEALAYIYANKGSQTLTLCLQVCVPLLQFCVGGMVSSVGFTPAKSGARTPTHNKLGEALVYSLYCMREDSHAFGSILYINKIMNKQNTKVSISIRYSVCAY